MKSYFYNIPIFLVLVFIFTLNIIKPVLAQDNIFVVSRINLDEVAENANIAKSKAVKKGQELAFKKLIERIVPDINIGDIKYDKEIVSSLIKSFEINDEELSATRYIASFTFYFKPEESKNYIKSITKGVIISAKPEPVLIIPIIRYSDIERGSSFWSEDNLWYIAWKNYDIKRSFIPIKLPLADMTDMQIAPENLIIKHDLVAISKLMQRHQAIKSIIAIFEMQDSELEHGLLHIYSYNNKYKEYLETIEIDANRHNIFNIAIDKVLALLEAKWKEQQTVLNSTTSMSLEESIVSNVMFNNIGEWIKIQRALNNNFTIKSTEVISLNAKNAKIKLQYIGSVEQLRLALQDEGLELSIPVVANYGDNNARHDIYEIRLKSGSY